MLGECHAHLAMDGVNYAQAMALYHSMKIIKIPCSCVFLRELGKV